VRSHIRDFDLSCRFGGEEFVVMLKNTGQQEGFTAAERILRMAGDSVFPQMREFRYSISIGLYSAVPGSDDTVETFIAKSDAALYRAKERGRNRIEL
jgi:diguanylate cyclase (GGDEF)-like protein